VIVSVSRRTDVPAHLTGWFLERLRAGFVEVPNPYNPRQRSRVSLAPEDVGAFVFWTRDARAFGPALDELQARGSPHYTLHTLTPYGPELEPGGPDEAQRLRSFLGLSDRLGPERVIWRYDPIILGTRWDADFHRRSFERLSRALEGRSRRVIVSLAMYYRKVERRLRPLEAGGLRFQREPLAEPAARGMLAELAVMAAARGLRIQSCAAPEGLGELGIPAGACIDPELLEALFGLHLPGAKDPGQRPRCGCARARDIGQNDTCPAGCLYCYANR
jgi:hypothetical protein